jgi:hypothetical protein
MAYRSAHAEQNRQKFNPEIFQKFLKGQGAMFDVFGLPETAVVSRRGKLGDRMRSSFSQKAPLVAEGLPFICSLYPTRRRP